MEARQAILTALKSGETQEAIELLQATLPNYLGLGNSANGENHQFGQFILEFENTAGDTAIPQRSYDLYLALARYFIKHGVDEERLRKVLRYFAQAAAVAQQHSPLKYTANMQGLFAAVAESAYEDRSTEEVAPVDLPLADLPRDMARVLLLYEASKAGSYDALTCLNAHALLQNFSAVQFVALFLMTKLANCAVYIAEKFQILSSSQPEFANALYHLYALGRPQNLESALQTLRTIGPQHSPNPDFAIAWHLEFTFANYSDLKMRGLHLLTLDVLASYKILADSSFQIGPVRARELLNQLLEFVTATEPEDVPLSSAVAFVILQHLERYWLSHGDRRVSKEELHLSLTFLEEYLVRAHAENLLTRNPAICRTALEWLGNQECFINFASPEVTDFAIKQLTLLAECTAKAKDPEVSAIQYEIYSAIGQYYLFRLEFEELSESHQAVYIKNALSIYGRILSQNKNDTGILMKCSGLHFDLGDYPAAVAQWNQVMEIAIEGHNGPLQREVISYVGANANKIIEHNPGLAPQIRKLLATTLEPLAPSSPRSSAASPASLSLPSSSSSYSGISISMSPASSSSPTPPPRYQSGSGSSPSFSFSAAPPHIPPVSLGSSMSGHDDGVSLALPTPQRPMATK